MNSLKYAIHEFREDVRDPENAALVGVSILILVILAVGVFG